MCWPLARKPNRPATISTDVVSKSAGRICEATKRFQIKVYRAS